MLIWAHVRKAGRFDAQRLSVGATGASTIGLREHLVVYPYGDPSLAAESVSIIEEQKLVIYFHP